MLNNTMQAGQQGLKPLADALKRNKNKILKSKKQYKIVVVVVVDSVVFC